MGDKLSKEDKDRINAEIEAAKKALESNDVENKIGDGETDPGIIRGVR